MDTSSKGKTSNESLPSPDALPLNRPIKVVHVTSRLNVGGLAGQVLAMCKGLNTDGFESTLVTGQVGEVEGDILAFLPPPERFHCIPELGRSVRPFADLIAFWKLFRFLRSVRPDVVHTHASKAGALGRAGALLAGVPVRVHSFHGHVFRDYFSPFVSSAIVRFEHAIGLITTAVVLPCESQRVEVCGTYNVVQESKARIVRYGIPVEDFSQLPPKDEARRRLGVDTEALLIGAIGRMTPVKNYGLLVESFLRLPAEFGGRPLHLLLVGDGECRPKLEASVRERGLLSRVHFRPWVEDVRWAFGAMDILALTSHNEGMPIAVLEAMAAGVPVVSTVAGGVVDLVLDGATGLLVRGKEPSAFSRRLEELLRDESLRCHLTERARRHVREHHSEEILIEDTKKLYKELLRGRLARIAFPPR